jgi:hypothetical protein
VMSDWIFIAGMSWNVSDRFMAIPILHRPWHSHQNATIQVLRALPASTTSYIWVTGGGRSRFLSLIQIKFVT